MRPATWRNWLVAVPFLLAACGAPTGGETDLGSNPFLEDQSNLGKADTAYINPDGIEVEVDIEADVEAPTYKLKSAPAQLGQFALTYLRKRGQFYLESLAETATSSTRVEWLVNDAWITAAEAATVDQSLLRRFRIRGINAVFLHSAATTAAEGKVFTATVPLQPYSVMTEANDSCADYNSHIDLSQSVYWYLWNPDKSGCTVTTQEMRVTVTKLLPVQKVTYPEYDQLVADGKVTSVVIFGKINEGTLQEGDPGFRAFERMANWLLNADFTEVTPAPVGRRFRKTVAGTDFEIDLYSPREFGGLSDYGNFDNFQTAIAEHEIVVYDGHSMMGASDFWARPTYPSFYQIFVYGGCLGYEYYVAPIVTGKGGWETVDIVSSVVEVSADANVYGAPFIAKVMWAVENGFGASWTDHLINIRRRVGDSTFGVSGAGGNCFSPTGSLCSEEPPATGTERRYESSGSQEIPDDQAAAVASTIEIPDDLPIGQVVLELDLVHSYIGDLRIALGHNGTEVVVWDRAGGAGSGIAQSFTLRDFAGTSAAGTWTLQIADMAAMDSGTLNSWALTIYP